ncbi:hypothetical protein AMATHDRAFT_4732 [Amanita thiersii Skay4041]|uniref:Mediator of RNA polymerase II transcription subunit 25 n=1 Tax=Amanita thiersii Skay4041 TaxID=703135 RepID=A0A2A9NMV0_9AGAR|nr:hypothetical protein AMATHDRAFT_4732 [Amanita thiersii Skay4041]
MPPSGSSMSKVSSPLLAVATLLLVENSSSMSSIWHILRDRYLPSIVKKIEGANSATSSSTFLVESSSPPGLNSPVPRQYKAAQSGSCELEFNHDVNNKLSAEKISTSIDLLTSITVQGRPTARHLIIVAASTPTSDYLNEDLTGFTGLSPWHQLAEKLAQENISCHLVLKPDQDMSPLRALFEETLRLRRCHEASSPFGINPTEAIIRLSATGELVNTETAVTTVVQPNATPRRASPRRTRTYPVDLYNGKAYDGQYGSSPHSVQTDYPSLVSQLQQVHGLTKKKVYGMKPPRTPFFRDESPRESYRRPAVSLPATLTDPLLASHQLLSQGGRSAPLSKLDRIARLSQRSSCTADISPRRWPYSTTSTGTASRLSSPEDEAVAVSSSSASSSSSSLPTGNAVHPQGYEQPIMPKSTPIQPVEAQYRMPTSHGHGHAAIMHAAASTYKPLVPDCPSSPSTSTASWITSGQEEYFSNHVIIAAAAAHASSPTAYHASSANYPTTPPATADVYSTQAAASAPIIQPSGSITQSPTALTISTAVPDTPVAVAGVEAYDEQSAQYTTISTSTSTSTTAADTINTATTTSTTSANATPTPTPTPPAHSRHHHHHHSQHLSSALAKASTLNDDEPFMFDPVFVAATTVMFQREVLPAYPEYAAELGETVNGNTSGGVVGKSSMSGDDGSGYAAVVGAADAEYSAVPYLPSYKAGQLYALRYGVSPTNHLHPSNHHPHHHLHHHHQHHQHHHTQQQHHHHHHLLQQHTHTLIPTTYSSPETTTTNCGSSILLPQAESLSLPPSLPSSSSPWIVPTYSPHATSTSSLTGWAG